MIFKYISIFLLMTLFLPKVSVAEEAKVPVNFLLFMDELNIITEIYPPYNFRFKGKLYGISVDIMTSMLKIIGSKQTREDIKLWPWARGYREVLENKNACLFSTTRTEEREKLFKWVGPISPTTISVIALKNKNIEINSINDLKKYRIGVAIDDIGEQLLVSAGIKLEKLNRMGGVDVILQSIKKLNKDRIDLFAYEENAVRWEMKTKGFNYEEYEIVYSLKKGEVFFVLHKGVSDQTIEKLQNVLDKIKENGEYKKILDKYLE